MKNSSTASRPPACGAAPVALPGDDDGSLAAWLALAMSPGISSGHGRRLLSAFGLPGRIFKAPRAALQRVVPPAIADGLGRDAALPAQVRAALDWAGAPGRHILCLADPRYPALLLQIPDPPLLLYAEGDITLLQRPAVAVVGSRHASRQGMQHARHFAARLSRAGVTIVSGLALGIDAAAHAGGLEGPGASIAVIGTGIDLCYPRRNEALAQQLAAQGCVISEYHPGTPPLALNFPRRNRLISGLARGVLVVEAALRSGSLVTARLAADQGREVFAIPGSIQSPLSRGCHALIRQGATLVEGVSDIIDELGLAALLPPAQQPTRDADDCQAGKRDADATGRLVMQAMGHDPVDADTLARHCGLDAAALAAVLLDLELGGHIELLPGPRYRRLG